MMWPHCEHRPRFPREWSSISKRLPQFSQVKVINGLALVN
jgi:hypothetical protein